METTVTSIHLNRAIQETCRFFMQILKNEEESYIPDYDVIYENYPDSDRIKIITYVISVAIHVYAQLPSKSVAIFSKKVGVWRAYVVKLCQEHSADIHHLPLEIDVFAGKNKMFLDFLICHWPFCNLTLSQMLEYLSEGFHGTFNIQPSYIDDYYSKWSKKCRRSEAIKCLANAMKWLHAVKRSHSVDQTKNLLKDNVMNLVVNSEIIMTNYENQFEEIWNELCAKFDSLPEYSRNRIDSYKFYCSILPILDDIKLYMHGLFVSDDKLDLVKLVNACHIVSEQFDSPNSWGLELTNLILTSLCTVLTPALYVKSKPIHKKFENDFKIFVDALGEKESINKTLIFAEFNYWVDRFKRKKLTVPINIDEYCQSFSNHLDSEAEFAKELVEYFVKVLTNDLDVKTAPGFARPVISQSKQLQKVILNSLKSSLAKLKDLDDYFPPITDSQMNLVFKIVEKLAQNSKLTLQEHFNDKVERTIEKFNVGLMKADEEIVCNNEMDDKTMIMPLFDEIDYKHYVSMIWVVVNRENSLFVQSNSLLDYLNDLKYDFLNKLDRIDLHIDRVVSRIIFYVGWRFKLRLLPISIDELFRFQLIFRFISSDFYDTPLTKTSLKKWTLTLQNYDKMKYGDDASLSVTPFNSETFYEVTKIESTKNRMILILQGQKSSASLKVTNFPRFIRGLEATKSLIYSVRLAYCRLNELNLRQKSDTPRNYILNSKTLESDLPMICSQLNADCDQVVAELHYMVNLVKKSIKDPHLLMKLEAKEYVSSRNSRDRSPSGRLKRKIEAESVNERSHKYQKIESEYPDPFHMYKVTTTTSKYDNMYDDDNEDDDQQFEGEEDENVSSQFSIQSKLNFIGKRASSTRLESRISYTSEPGPQTICIDPGKDKARPARFVKIERFSDRPINDISVRPSICKNRKRSQMESKSLYNFKVTRIISTGAFGKICQANDQSTQQKVALKRIAISKHWDNGIPQSIFRETTILRTLKHPNIVRFIDVVVDDLETIKSTTTNQEKLVPKSFYFVFEYMNHDLRGLLDSKSMIFSYEQIGFLSKQLFRALEYIHDENIIHRDITPSNVLLNNRGILKLCDFGNARYLMRDVNLNQQLQLTPRNVRLFYRAPEILLEMNQYGFEVDIWACGCILYELLVSQPLFQFQPEFTTIEMVEEISRILGSPNESVWNNVSNSCFFVNLATTGIAINYIMKLDDYMEKVPHDAAEVLKEIFMWDPKKRITASKALFSPWIEGVTMQTMEEQDFPDQDYHEQSSMFASMTEEQLVVETTPSMTKTETSVVVPDSQESQEEEIEVDEADMMNQEEELKKFVQNLSGRILEFGEVLDLFRLESPPYTAEVGRGLIMHAARRWSHNEYQRVKLVEFMLNYLLSDSEKDALKLTPVE